MAGESYFDYAKTASDIGLHDMQKQKLKFDMVKDLPDDTGGADVMAGLAQSWNAPGQQRGAKGSLRALFMGMASGMKGEANRAKRERLEKLLVGAEGWEDANNSMKQMLESKKQEALLNEKLQPAMDDLTVGSASGDDANSLLSRANDWMKPLEAAGVVPTGSQVVGVLPDKYRLIYRTPDGQEKSINYLQKSSKGAQEKIKLILEQKGMNARTMSAEASMMRAKDEHNMYDVNKEHKQAYIKDVDNRWDGGSQYNRSFGQEQGKEEAKRIGELDAQNVHLEDKKWQIKELQDMLKGGKVITGQTLGSWYARSTGKNLNTEAMSETEAFDALSKNLLGFVKGDVKFGNMNQKEFEWLAKQTPDSTMTKGGIERILNRLESSIERSLKRNESEMSRRPNYNSHDARSQPTSVQPAPPDPTAQGAGGKGGGTTITLLKDGKTKTIPTSDYAKSKALAKQQGFGVVE